MEPKLTPTPNPAPGSRKLLVIVGGSLVVVVLLGIGLITLLTSFKTPLPSTTSSGTPKPTPTPSNPAKAPQQLSYVGFQKLIDDGGLSKDQLDALKYALKKYTTTTQPSTKTITVNSSSVRSFLHSSTQPRDYATFKAAFDGTSRDLKVEYFNLTSIRLLVLDSKGATTHDSGTIDIYKGIGNQ